MNRAHLCLYLLLSSLMLMACTKVKPTPAPTPEFIHKDGIVYSDRMESTPFVWNGELYSMVSARELHKIEIYKENVLVSHVDTDIKFACVLVDNNTLYVFGSVDYKSMEAIETQDLLAWSIPKILFTVDYQIFNSSVTKSDTGFVMVLETCESRTTCFNARFLSSTDLLSWNFVGNIFHSESYAACPTIRYVDGQFYIFYLRQVGDYFATYVSRTQDFVTFKDSPQVVVSTRLYESDEGINASDLDLVEFNGKVYINYADGDQLTWNNVRRAHYDGTLTQLVAEYFKE